MSRELATLEEEQPEAYSPLCQGLEIKPFSTIYVERGTTFKCSNGHITLCYTQEGKECAVKVVKQDYSSAIREGMIGRVFRSPSVVRYDDVFFDEDTRQVIVQMEECRMSCSELVKNMVSTLSKDLSHGCLPWADVSLLFIQMVNAVRHIHQKQVFHRDITLSHFMVSKDGIVKLGNFKAAVPAPSNTESWAHELPGGNVGLGTLAYLPPEVLGGVEAAYAGDWWALGVVLFQLLHGGNAWPFKRNLPTWTSTNTIKLLIKSGEIKWNRDVRYGRAVVELVEGLLDPTPTKRWGLTKVLACSAIGEGVMKVVGEMHPGLAVDMNELMAIRQRELEDLGTTQLEAEPSFVDVDISGINEPPSNMQRSRSGGDQLSAEDTAMLEDDSERLIRRRSHTGPGVATIIKGLCCGCFE